MTKAEKSLIFKIAKKVRLWGERLSNRHPNFSDELRAMCGICSYKLWTSLSEIGIKSSLVLGVNHVYVVVGKWLLDVTATQFFLVRKKVVFRLLSGKPDWQFWRETRRLETYAEARQFFSTWPKWQTPFYWSNPGQSP